MYAAMSGIYRSDFIIDFSHLSVSLSFSAIDLSTDGNGGISSLNMVPFGVPFDESVYWMLCWES